MVGRYCSSCGQRALDPADLSARRFFHELADELATLDVKFKTLQSLRGLLVPGFLTAEFLAGRRQDYLRPIQLYFVCAALFFLAAPFAGFTLASLVASDQSGDLARLVAERSSGPGFDTATFSQRFDLRVQSVYTLGLGVGVIAVALTLQLFRRAMPFGAHLVFALHYFSFLYLLTILAGASRRLGRLDEVAAAIAICLTGAYLFMAMMRAYPGPAGARVLQSAVLLLVTLACNFAANAGAIRLTLALV
jgi:hypothetical protein